VSSQSGREEPNFIGNMAEIMPKKGEGEGEQEQEEGEQEEEIVSQ
jgi:hypothetical protein